MEGRSCFEALTNFAQLHTVVPCLDKDVVSDLNGVIDVHKRHNSRPEFCLTRQWFTRRKQVLEYPAHPAAQFSREALKQDMRIAFAPVEKLAGRPAEHHSKENLHCTADATWDIMTLHKMF